jgi:AraC-like DNA-binding protein
MAISIIEDLVRMYEMGLSLDEISAETGLMKGAIASRLRDKGYKVWVGYSPKIDSYTAEQLDELTGDYYGGMPINDIAEKWGFSSAIAFHVFRLKQGWIARTQQPEVRAAKEQLIQEAMHMYQYTNISIIKIAAETGLSVNTIHLERARRHIPDRFSRGKCGTAMPPPPKEPGTK